MAQPLEWTAAATDGTPWSLQYVTDDLLQAAQAQDLAFEAHHFGIWVPDFWCGLRN